jgi:hypothetical protein
VCLAGASWVRENVTASRDDVRVYVVWLPMLPTDSRGEWRRSRLPGATAQFWDGGRIVGRYLADEDLGGLGSSGVVWDAWFVFSPDATWNERPTGLVASGSPVITSTATLEDALS